MSTLSIEWNIFHRLILFKHVLNAKNLESFESFWISFPSCNFTDTGKISVTLKVAALFVQHSLICIFIFQKEIASRICSPKWPNFNCEMCTVKLCMVHNEDKKHASDAEFLWKL